MLALQHAEGVTTISGFLSRSVKLHGRRTISGKLLAFGFVATMQPLSKHFDLMYLYVEFSVNQLKTVVTGGAIHES